MDKKIVSFGEMLWDVFPAGSIAGGAPMNVALHLRHLGTDVSLISRVGNDKEGQDLLAFIKDYGLHQKLIQIDQTCPTGKVIVDDGDKENIRYNIVKPAAWDQIEWSEKMQEQVDLADAFIFGSLAAREETSRNTLLTLLETQTLKVLDINLRAPFYSFEVLKKLLSLTDILKINEEELTILSGFHHFPNEMEPALDKLTELYDLNMICVTLGKDGALIYSEEELIKHPGYRVIVQDTVGSGDAFLGAFIYSYLMDKTPEQILDDACALGALVATRKGGTPKYDQQDIDKIKAE
ncbi:MAG: carbohydrate kinase [Anditalea sp.]